MALPPICGSGLEAIVELDGSDITSFCKTGSWTPRLNRPAQFQVTVPMDAGTVDPGQRLKLTLSAGGTANELVFHGMVLNTEIDTNKDGGTIAVNAMDPMELWQYRPVRADDADFSMPVGTGVADGTDLIATYDNAPAILEAVLINTVQNPNGPNGGGPPEDAEGPIFLDMGTFTPGTASMAGAPVDWPMTIMDFFSLLVSTGQIDVFITPTDPGGGVMGTIDASPQILNNLSADVRFEYGTGLFSASSVRWNRDMTNMTNKYWIYGGPRVKSAADPAGDQHWCFNVTGTDGGLLAGFPGPPNGLAYPPGGQSVDGSNSPNFGAHSADDGWTDNPLGHRIYDSRQAYGVRMKVDIFDQYDADQCAGLIVATGHELSRFQWQVYSWMSALPREIIHITPTADTFINCFNVGDLVHVEAVSDVGGGFSGSQRVMEYTVSWDQTPSVLTLSEIQTSSDGDVG